MEILIENRAKIQKVPQNAIQFAESSQTSTIQLPLEDKIKMNRLQKIMNIYLEVLYDEIKFSTRNE